MTISETRQQAIDDIVRNARVRFLLVQSPAGILISPLGGLAISYALLDSASLARLVVWNLGLLGLAALRFWLWVRSPRKASTVSRPHRWEWLMGGTMVSVALWWGVGGVLVLPGTPLSDLLIFCTLMMMAGGTGALYSIHPVASALSVLCISVPIMLHFGWSETLFMRVLGFGTVLLVLGILRGIQTLNKFLVRTHELSYDLEDNISLLKRSEEMRRDLTLMLVHDLRTPLAGLITNVHLAREYAEEDNSEESLAEIQKTAELAESLILMVSSILDVNRLESDQMPLFEETVSVEELVSLSLGNLGSGSNSVVVESPENVSLRCDVELLSRVLTNLLANALRFSPPGEEVVLRISLCNDSLEFRVIDKGPGIGRHDQTRIFDKYTRASRQARAYTSGLGLTFCRMAVERHGGAIGVESEPERGSEFWFQLPALEGKRRGAKLSRSVA